MKITPKRILLVSILGFLIGVFLANIYEIGLCKKIFCSDIIEECIGIPIGFFSISLAFISLVSFFVQEEIFHFWIKFAKYYLPIAALLIVLSPETGGGGFGFSMGFDTELTTWWTAGLFFIISLIIIIYKTISIRRKEKLFRTNS